MHGPGAGMLTERFDAAVLYALAAHRRQMRKDTMVPYAAHLLGTAALALEAGGDEDQAIAALLHDVVEDQGGASRLDDVRRCFGERVARIVEGCTDAVESPPPPWRERKERYLAHLAAAPDEVVLVALADKLHNARAVLAGLRQEGPAVWAWFAAGEAGQRWYYRSLVEVLGRRSDSFLARELALTVAAFDAV